MAEALKAMKGPSARADELWIACASRVFPVPVSPSNTMGTSDLAASLAKRIQRAIASLVVRKSSTLKAESFGCIPPAA